jgi:hypothetical protein
LAVGNITIFFQEAFLVKFFFSTYFGSILSSNKVTIGTKCINNICTKFNNAFTDIQFMLYYVTKSGVIFELDAFFGILVS